MPFPSNRPVIEQLERQLRISAADAQLTGIDVDALDRDWLDEQLETSIDMIEDRAHTSFDGRAILEVRDGNGTNSLQLFKWPIGRVTQVKVELPVLALTRVYLPDEVKVYRFGGRVKIFTYKLAAEQASLHLDAQVYGNLLPPLPQCVFVNYTYGFPQYDPEANAGAGATTFDGGTTIEPGDTRDPLDKRHLRLLKQAAIADAAASVLGQGASLAAGLVSSVSFDGFSKSLNPAGYESAVSKLEARRDELLGGRRRGTYLSTN